MQNPNYSRNISFGKLIEETITCMHKDVTDYKSGLRRLADQFRKQKMWLALERFDSTLQRILAPAKVNGQIAGSKRNYYLEDIFDDEGQVQLAIAQSFYK